MTDKPTPDEVRASIVPKSDQLNADDLLTGPITVTITKVSRGTKEQPIYVHIDGGHQPFRPCKSMRRVLIAVFSDDPLHWTGKKLTLYCDPDVLYGGVRVGGIRISHMSGLDNPRTFMLTKSRGNRSEVTIHPVKTGVDQAQIDGLKTPWAEKHAEVTASMDKDEQRTAFGRWVNDTLGRTIDATDLSKWTAEDVKKCKEALG